MLTEKQANLLHLSTGFLCLKETSNPKEALKISRSQICEFQKCPNNLEKTPTVMSIIQKLQSLHLLKGYFWSMGILQKALSVLLGYSSLFHNNIQAFKNHFIKLCT